MRTFQQGSAPSTKYEAGRLIWQFDTQASGFACGWDGTKPTIEVEDGNHELAEMLLANGAIEVI